MTENIHFFWWAISLAIVALAGTIYVFRHRLFDRGYRKGRAADPQKVRQQNPRDRYASR